jgi:type II secretory pathway predicted ATPase ExeA
MQKINGFDDALFGVALVWGSDGSRIDVLVYDAERIRDKLMVRDGMTSEEAREYIEFNIEGAYVGQDTPIIAWREDLVVMVNDEQ